MAITPLQSRIEELLANGSNAVKPQSRIEILLVELLQFIETGMASVFHYKGSVATYADLLLITGAEVGDVYNVESDSMNYAWDGTAWDTLGAILAIDSTITQDSQNPVTSAAIYSALAGKVDAIVGKGLSTEDYTTAEKEKLSGIGSGAEANVQSDWSQSDNTADDYIKNKPTLGTAASHDVASAIGDTTDIPTAAQVNTALAGKQDALKTAQQAAVDSSITSAKVAQYDKDSAALPEVVDGGAKNLLYPNSGSGTAINLCDMQKYIKSGAYHLYFNASDYSGKYELQFYDINGNYISGGLNANISEVKSIDFTLSEDAYRVVFKIAGTAEISNLMFCTKATWDVSQKYVPYCPSMAELNDGGILSRVYGNENIVDIPSNSDLDTYMTPGIYGCSLSTVASTLDNCPTTFGFKMEIRTTASSTRLSQFIYENVATGDMYARVYYGSGWSVWNRVETNNSVFGRGTSIASGTNLDNLTSIGTYYSNDKTRSQSLTNSPFTTTGFTLEVKKSYQSQSDTDGINQIAYSYVSNAFTIKARTLRYLSSPSPGAWSWTDWQTLTFATT